MIPKTVGSFFLLESCISNSELLNKNISCLPPNKINTISIILEIFILFEIIFYIVIFYIWTLYGL